MIEVVILSNRPFGSKQAITGFKDLQKILSGNFFSRIGTPEMLLTLSLRFFLAESSESNEKWHLSMPKYVLRKTFCCTYYFVITWLQFFYREYNFYTFFLGIQWRGQWKEILNEMIQNERKIIFFLLIQGTTDATK